MAADNRVGFQIAAGELLQLLRIKGGVGPNALRLDVDPSVDVTDFYGQASHTVIREVGAAGNIGAGIASTLALAPYPKRMLAASVGILLGAAPGTYLTMAIGYSFDPGVITNFVILNSVTIAPAPPLVAAGVYRCGVSFDRIIIPANARIFGAINGNAGGADHTPTLEYSFQRLDGLP